tara:strand:- start:799 stop:1980 length:1182 start_codon:yes stop_codon:yes gene_type:complete
MVDFKIKNGLDAARIVTKVGTVGSGPTLDLSTGTYFQSSLSAATTFSFSNPPETGKALNFSLELSSTAYAESHRFPQGLPTGISDDIGYGTSTSNYSNMRVKPDGSILTAIVQPSTTRYLQKFPISDPSDITTLDNSVTTGTSIGSNSATTMWRDFSFSDDGTRIYKLINKNIYYGSTTNHDAINFANSNGKLFTGQEFTSFEVVDSGTKLYMLDSAAKIVYQYALSTAWDTQSATSVGQYSLNTTSTVPSAVLNAYDSLRFSSDGTYFYVSGFDSSPQARDIQVYQLSTPWDITTASITTPDKYAMRPITPNNFNYFCFNAVGDTFYMMVKSTITYKSRVTTFNTANPLALSFSSTVKWSGGVVPKAPAPGKKKIINFYTIDGGSTYFGAER